MFGNGEKLQLEPSRIKNIKKHKPILLLAKENVVIAIKKEINIYIYDSKPQYY